jgi:Zn-dependent peptidase ImmA (M78 family)
MQQTYPPASVVAQSILQSSWNGQFPVKPIQIAEDILAVRNHGENACQYPVTIQPRSRSVMGPASGFASFVDTNTPHFLCAFNHHEPSLHQKYVQAYELAHVMMGHIEDKPGVYRRDINVRHTGDIETIQCAEFANELLMPEDHIRKMVMTKKSLQQMAAVYALSTALIRHRLMTLRLI